jgi:hypothetical protein
LGGFTNGKDEAGLATKVCALRNFAKISSISFEGAAKQDRVSFEDTVRGVVGK